MSESYNHVDRAIGRRVRARRDELGLSDEEVAQEIDVTIEHFERMECGSLRISLEHLRMLSDLLKVKPSYFFETIEKIEDPAVDKVSGTNWLSAALGKGDVPTPPDLASARIKEMLGRALLVPGSLTPIEVQELAASVLCHLVNARG